MCAGLLRARLCVCACVRVCVCACDTVGGGLLCTPPAYSCSI